MTESLNLAIDDAPALSDPVLLVALGGWFDAAGVATSALRLIAGEANSVVVGEIDPDPFYDFTVARPSIENVDGERCIAWPGNVLRTVRTPATYRDLVALNGVEPHVGWPTYVARTRRRTPRACTWTASPHSARTAAAASTRSH